MAEHEDWFWVSSSPASVYRLEQMSLSRDMILHAIDIALGFLLACLSVLTLSALVKKRKRNKAESSQGAV
jgi:hypothetical protein